MDDVKNIVEKLSTKEGIGEYLLLCENIVNRMNNDVFDKLMGASDEEAGEIAFEIFKKGDLKESQIGPFRNIVVIDDHINIYADIVNYIKCCVEDVEDFEEIEEIHIKENKIDNYALKKGVSEKMRKFINLHEYVKNKCGIYDRMLVARNTMFKIKKIILKVPGYWLLNEHDFYKHIEIVKKFEKSTLKFAVNFIRQFSNDGPNAEIVKNFDFDTCNKLRVFNTVEYPRNSIMNAFKNILSKA